MPIALGLLLMMYPVLAKVRYEELGRMSHDGVSDRRFFGVSLFLSWLVGPALMFALAWLLLADQPAYRTGVIIVGLARCIAMVLVWNDIASGDRERAAVLVVFNALFQVVAYSLLGYFYLTRAPGLARSRHAGLRVGHLGGRAHGADLPRHPARRRLSHPPDRAQAHAAATGTSSASSRGSRRSRSTGCCSRSCSCSPSRATRSPLSPLDVARIALPLLAYFAVMWLAGFGAGRLMRMPYAQTASLAFTVASNDFELAIAVAVGVFGATSGQALAGVVGPLIEVPVLVSLVYVALWASRRLRWPEPRAGAAASSPAAQAAGGGGVEV